MGAARIGTFGELIADVGPEVRAIAVALRDLVREVHPDAVEVVRLGDRAATYGIGPRKMVDGYAYLMPQAGYVNLGFYQGARLPDPDGLLEGSGATMRHVKVRDLVQVRVPGVRDLLESAVTERREAGQRR